MWVTVLVLLVVIASLLLALAMAQGRVEYLRSQVRCERALRVATEVAFCSVVEEQLGDRLRANRSRVSEAAWVLGKSEGHGRGPN